jgi:hypothetical protein
VSEERWYKVLDSGRSCDGGDFTWSLPTADEPGEWHEIPAEQPLRLCAVGFHLTSDPVAGGWYRQGRTIYLAEYDGERVGPVEGGDKCAVRKVRLVKRLDGAELAALRIAVSGIHEARSGSWIASDSAEVEAYGSAQVRAYGSAQVLAYDSAQVEAYGSAQVRAYGSAQVRASDSAQVRAYGSAQVEASDSAQVRAEGRGAIRASGKVVVAQYHGESVVRLHQHARRVDMRGERPRCFRAKTRLPR